MMYFGSRDWFDWFVVFIVVDDVCLFLIVCFLRCLRLNIIGYVWLCSVVMR